MKHTMTLTASILALATAAQAQAQTQEPVTDEDDVIIITGTRGAISSAIQEERDADQFKSVITADDIGQFADQNVAESLQRVPGVSITRDEGEGQQVSIRGLPTDFATITIDGARLGSRDPESSAVNLDVISSDLLSGIEVVKTLTPDLDADAVAGTVNLRTLSAFDRGKNSVSARAEYSYAEKAEEGTPKFSGDFTRLIDMDNGGRFGIAGGLSWSERKTVVDDFRFDDGLRYVCVQDGFIFDGEGTRNGEDYECQESPQTADSAFLSLRRIDQRNDPAERTRFSGNLNLEYEPSEGNRFYLRGTYAYFEDDDIRARERIELDDGSNDLDEAQDDDAEILDISATGGRFLDVDFSKRYRFTDQEDELYSISLGGEHDFNDVWLVDYGIDFSSNESDIPSIEPRFRVRDNEVIASNQSEDGIDFEVLSEDGEPLTPDDFGFRFLTQLDDFSTDDLTTYKANFERKYEAYGREASFKFGGKFQTRERTFDRNRANIESDQIDSLADFDTAVPDTTDLDLLFFPDLGQLRSAALDAAATGTVDNDALFANFENIAEDFSVDEEVTALYAMTTFLPAENVQIIAGLRYEDTQIDTTGTRYNVVEYNEDATELFEDAFDTEGVDGTAEADAFLAARQNDVPFTPFTDSNDYTNWFPNAHLRWDLAEDTVFRMSYTEAIKRPRYSEIAAIVGFQSQEDIDEDDVEDAIDALGGGVTVAEAEQILADLDADTSFEVEGTDIRNPQLDPLVSKNYDASIAWYPNRNTVLSAAVFYKDISDFIVSVTVRGDDVTRFGFEVADGTVDGGPEQISTVINGDSAEVYGLELNYYQAYTFLPGIWDGLFASANLTFADSEASVGITDRKITLPEQSDVIGNFSVGYEDDKTTLRLSGNYQGERFREINGGALEDVDNPAGDIIDDARFSMDFNARYRVNENVQVYFDALNFNDAEDIQLFEGDDLSGRIYSRIENYGATYQVGARFNF